METKCFFSDIKAIDDESTEDKGVFEGYANTFGNIDLVDDIVHKGAFKKTLKESKKRALFFMHNTFDLNSMIGEATDLKEDDNGLKMKAEIDLSDPMGAKAWKYIKRGTIDRMSIGFQILKADFEDVKGKMIRNLRELKLFEISIIPIGMAANPESLINPASIKSIDDVLGFIKANKNDDEFVKKVISLFREKPEGLITLIKSMNPSTIEDEPNDNGDEQHYQNILNILNGGN